MKKNVPIKNAWRLGEGSDPQTQLTDVGEAIKLESVGQKYVSDPLDLHI